VLDVEDTIVAIASASGPAIRGIVRVAGPDAVALVGQSFVAERACGKAITDLDRASSLVGEFEFDNGLSVPVTAMVWPDHRSYTRQPTVEIHTFGSTPVLRKIVSAIESKGARLAQPGEFTLRAFLSGRLDLTQAEAVLAVIDAENQNQFEVALQQLAGGLAGPLGELRTRLLSVLAEVEAGLDFVEEDIEFISADQMVGQLSDCHRALVKIVDQIDQRDSQSHRPRVVLVGLPNSGKSSLFNVLTQSSQAIVTDIAGTTTDYISAVLKLSNSEVELVDTAGFESATGEISASAQQLRGQQADRADVRVLCIDGQILAVDQQGRLVFRNLDSPASVWIGEQVGALREQDLVIVTKSDLLDAHLVDGQTLLLENEKEVSLVFTSSQTESGIDAIAREIEAALRVAAASSASVVGSTVQRASSSLREAGGSVEAAVAAAENQMGDEIVAAEIREALNSLGLVVGVVYTDDILDLVFGRFCIGK
jgi:tRNA modification GTPase